VAETVVDTAVIPDADPTPPGIGLRSWWAGRWWRRAGLVALLLVAGTGGLHRAVDVEALSRPGDASPEAGFARDMAAHHTQAVEMALLAYPKAELPTTRTMAYAIATSQQGQIEIMDTC